jgi:hypothetical protein
METLEELIHIGHTAAELVEITEVAMDIGVTLGWVSHASKVLAVVETASFSDGLVNTVATPLLAIFEVAKAYTHDEELTGCAGWGYGVTAWMYGDAMPLHMPDRINTESLLRGKARDAGNAEAWEKNVKLSWESLDHKLHLIEQKMHKPNIKRILQDLFKVQFGNAQVMAKAAASSCAKARKIPAIELRVVENIARQYPQ